MPVVTRPRSIWRRYILTPQARTPPSAAAVSQKEGPALNSGSIRRALSCGSTFSILSPLAQIDHIGVSASLLLQAEGPPAAGQLAHRAFRVGKVAEEARPGRASLDAGGHVLVGAEPAADAAIVFHPYQPVLVPVGGLHRADFDAGRIRAVHARAGHVARLDVGICAFRLRVVQVGPDDVVPADGPALGRPLR